MRPRPSRSASNVSAHSIRCSIPTGNCPPAARSSRVRIRSGATESGCRLTASPRSRSTRAVPPLSRPPGLQYGWVWRAHGSRTTPSRTRRCPSKTAWLQRRSMRPPRSASRRSVAHRPAISRTPWRRRRRGPVSKPGCSSRKTWKPRRSSARPYTARTWCACAAITTT